MPEAGDPAVSQLPAAILRALADMEAAGTPDVSLPRLGKRLRQGASVLMRQLTLMGDAAIGGMPGPGWVRVERQDERWLVRLTEAGRAMAQALAADAPAD